MSESKVPARPPQVTMAGWVTVVGSVFMLIETFGVVSGLRSIDRRESVEEALSKEPLKGTGIDLQQALSLMHGTALVAGACAAAAAILGWFVLQRNHQARLALSIVAVPLFFSGLVTGGFAPALVAVSVVILWGRPARDWFNGVTPRERPDTPWQPAREPGPTEPPRQQGPRAFEGFGSRPTDEPLPPEHQQPWPGQQADQHNPHQGEQAATQPQPVAQRATTDQRPREVAQACAFTWAMSATALLGMLVVLVAFALSPDIVEEVYESDSRFAESGVSVSALRAASIGVAVAFSVWSVAAMALAWLAFRGINWARVLLIVSACGAAAVSLLIVLSSPVLLVVTGTAVFTVVLLTRPAAAAWYVEKTRQRRGW